jgi:hypothetical protein
MRVALRILGGIFGLLDIATGLWAIAAPDNWYRRFPGLGQHWVAGQGPFNEHLVTDAGAGFLAVGVVVLVGVLSGRRTLERLAGVALLMHALPHFLFHLLNPDAHLNTMNTLASTGGLGFEAFIGLLLLIPTRSRPVRRRASV